MQLQSFIFKRKSNSEDFGKFCIVCDSYDLPLLRDCDCLVLNLLKASKNREKRGFFFIKLTNLEAVNTTHVKVSNEKILYTVELSNNAYHLNCFFMCYSNKTKVFFEWKSSFS